MSAAVSAMLALVLGESVEGREFSWETALRVARHERCAPLAWLRSGSEIRRLAPAAVSTAWRAEALAALELSRFWMRVVEQALTALDEAAVHCAVLKGLPLSQRIYGDISARPCADLDLYVPLRERAAAHEALCKAGWTWKQGEPPDEAGYLLESERRTSLLEVHSFVLDDPLVRHLSFDLPASTPVRIGTRIVPAHDDSQLPSVLATHLAKHAMPPVLWFVDFLTLWDALGPDGRRDARHAARTARAYRYLLWACSRSSDVRLAARGDSHAMRRLGFRGDRRVDAHNAMRVAALAANPRDALRVVAAWASPSVGAHRFRRVREFLWKARAKPLARMLGTRHSYVDGIESHATMRSLPIDATQLESIVRDLAGTGRSMWIRASGTSMSPTIVPGASVRLTPWEGGALSVGDVVLTRSVGDRFVIHRICRIDGRTITTRGDANFNNDPPVDIVDVLATVDRAAFRGQLRPVVLLPGARAARAVRVFRAWLRRGPGRRVTLPSERRKSIFASGR